MENQLNILQESLLKLGLGSEARQVKTASSISSIISLGYPPLLAKIIREMFGKNSYLVAKWIQDYYGTRLLEQFGGAASGYFGKSNIQLYLELYDAASKGGDAYRKFQEKNGFEVEEFPELDLKKSSAIEEIKEAITNDIFFYNSFTKEILTGNLTDLNQYKKLSYNEALEKHNRKRIFQDAEPMKVYSDGYRWVNVGPKCELVGREMSNCGSAGVMSADPDKTILTLFDENNKPHVLLTYSPNDHRISGFEGAAGSEPKDKYHNYILDLENLLGAKIDTDSVGGQSKFLKLKVLLKNFAQNIERIPGQSTFEEYFKITNLQGNIYISNYYTLIPEDIVEQYISELKQEDPSESLYFYLNRVFRMEDLIMKQHPNKILYPNKINYELRNK